MIWLREEFLGQIFIEPNIITTQYLINSLCPKCVEYNQVATECPRKIVPRLCSYCGGVVDLITSVSSLRADSLFSVGGVKRRRKLPVERKLYIGSFLLFAPPH